MSLSSPPKSTPSSSSSLSPQSPNAFAVDQPMFNTGYQEGQSMSPTMFNFSSQTQIQAGLEALAPLDACVVHQKMETLELVTDYETSNSYEIKNVLGATIFVAVEESRYLIRQWCGTQRPFTMHVLDYTGKQVLTINRPFRCHCFCCPICLQKLTIYTANDKRLGKVRQECYICRPSFKIIDENGYKVFIVKAPCFTSPCGCDIEFSIYQKGKKVGKIVKRWAEYEREVFTDADVFAVFFPKNIDVKSKALLLAATFLIDFMYFENEAESKANREKVKLLHNRNPAFPIA